MKILQINCVYGKGSTGKITRDLHHGLLARGYASAVIYGRGQKVHEPHVYKLCSEGYAKLNNLRSRIDGMMYTGAHIATTRIIRKIKEEKPDVIHVQCINGYFCHIFRLLNFIKSSRIPCVLTLHAEFMYTANCGYAGDCEQWRDGCKKCPVLRKETLSWFFDRTGASWKRMHGIFKDWPELTVVGCSDWISRRAAQSGSLRDKTVLTLHNGIDNQSVFYPREGSREKLREAYGIPAEHRVILYVAPVFSELKGFDLLLKVIEAASELPVHFVLVGDDRAVNLPHVTVVGRVADQHELAELYSAADALFICSRNDNYPTVCLEAQSCGARIIAYDVGGVKETIYPRMGVTFPPEAVDLVKAYLADLPAGRIDPALLAQARAYHSKERMIQEYADLYEKILKERSKCENK